MRWLLVVFSLVSLGAQPLRLTLREAMDLAVKESPEVQQARLSEVSSYATAEIARAALRPQVSVEIGGQRLTNNLQGIGLVYPGLPAKVGPYNVFNARPVVTQPIYDRRLNREFRAAQAQTRQTVAETAAVQQGTRWAVVQAYLAVRAADSRVAAAQARLRTATTALERTQQLREAGTASRLDQARAELERQNETAVVVGAQRERAVGETLLRKALGLLDDTPLELTERLDEPTWELQAADAVLSTARRERPEFQALIAKADAARASREAAESGRLPRVGVAGDYGRLGAGFADNVSTFTLAASVTVPIWLGGRTKAEVAAATARERQVASEERALVLQVRQEVAAALIVRESAWQTWQTTRTATEAARVSLELSQAKFDSGILNNLDVVTAQGALASAEDAEIRARYDFHLAAAALARAQGRL